MREIVTLCKIPTQTSFCTGNLFVVWWIMMLFFKHEMYSLWFQINLFEWKESLKIPDLDNQQLWKDIKSRADMEAQRLEKRLTRLRRELLLRTNNDIKMQFHFAAPLDLLHRKAWEIYLTFIFVIESAQNLLNFTQNIDKLLNLKKFKNNSFLMFQVFSTN